MDCAWTYTPLGGGWQRTIHRMQIPGGLRGVAGHAGLVTEAFEFELELEQVWLLMLSTPLNPHGIRMRWIVR